MWRKIRLVRPPTRPLPRETFLLAKTKTGDEIVVWNSVPYPQEGSDAWLLGNSTDPMPTEPHPLFEEPEQVEIRYRKRCDCRLIPGEWCCCPTPYISQE